MKTIITLLLLLVITECHRVNEQNWRQIIPLNSTRADVERLLGQTKDDYLATYLMKEGSLIVVYSSGPCSPERKGGWNVPENIVLNVRFSPKHKKRITELALDPQKFKKVFDDHVIGVIYYVNDEEGITYEVQEGKVFSIEYGPAKRYEHLYCGDTLIRSRSFAERRTTTKWDQSADASE